MKNRRLNQERILSNVVEARQELLDLETKIKSAKEFSETDFEISLRHAYHHLNFAWNVRHAIQNREYRKNISDENFDKWGSFPVGMDTLVW